MNELEAKKQIQKYGRIAYIAEKDAIIQKKFDPTKKELDLFLPYPTPVSIFEKPFSLIGAVSHQRVGDKWPAIEENLYMHILQITTDLTNFHDLFGPDNQLITVYCPQNAFYLDKEDRWEVNVKEHALSDNMTKVMAPKDAPQEKIAHCIKWKKVIDYPSRDLFDLFYPQELIDAIYQIEELHDTDYYRENFPTSEHTKIGGYPYCVQAEPDRWQSNAQEWKFIMQIDQNDFERLNLVHQGIMTIFRHEHTKEWAAEVQFY